MQTSISPLSLISPPSSAISPSSWIEPPCLPPPPPSWSRGSASTGKIHLGGQTRRKPATLGRHRSAAAGRRHIQATRVLAPRGPRVGSPEREAELLERYRWRPRGRLAANKGI